MRAGEAGRKTRHRAVKRLRRTEGRLSDNLCIGCVRAIAQLARMEAGDLASAYGGDIPRFGPDYLIPRPFDPRLLVMLAPAE